MQRLAHDKGADSAVHGGIYISNEGVSLLENSARLGLPIPQKMKDVLAQLHDRSEKGDNHE